MDKTFYCLLGALTATAAATVAVISTYDAPAPQQDGDSSARVRMIWQLRTRANSLIESQNYPVALLVLNRLSRQEPGNASFQRLLVRVLYETGRNDDAILICRKLLACNPDNATSRNNLGVLLTASGSVNGDAVDLESGNAIVPLTVINNPGFDLPKTGGYGTWMFTVGGVALLGAAAFIVVKSRKRNQ